MRKNKKELFLIFENFINTHKLKAKAGDYDYNDDYKTFKMIYAIAELFPLNEKYYRNEPEIEKYLKELWFLYFYFKHRATGKSLTYRQIVIKYG